MRTAEEFNSAEVVIEKVNRELSQAVKKVLEGKPTIQSLYHEAYDKDPSSLWMENYSKRKWSGPFINPESQSSQDGLLFCLVNGNDFIALFVSFKEKMVGIMLGNKTTKKHAMKEYKD